MFGSKKKKAEKEAKKKAEHSRKIREEAMAKTRAAKVAIGDEALQKIAALMAQKENSALEKAKRDIAAADPDRVLDELKWMLEQKE